MAIYYNDFIHPSDRKALDALKAVPGFDLVLKKCMSIIGEKMFRIEATSTYLKLGPDQLPEIYEILVRVCDKLDIAIPDLYLSLDRSVNAGTLGDTNVFVVINSGLIETLTLEQIETVIAHECGHIVCHHVLYHTMGEILVNAATYFANDFISKAAIGALRAAYFYWNRCSEFSADRVSAYYHESAEPVIDVMMALSGGTSNLGLKLNREAFLRQAEEYKVLIDNSSYNKVLEFVQFWDNSHPLNAYRAYEINEFYKRYTAKYLSGEKQTSAITDGAEKRAEKFVLRIKYEYIKPKGLLKLGGLFDNDPLEIKIDKTKYTVSKNDSIDITLPAGEHECSFKNANKKIKHSIRLCYNVVIVVSWDGSTEKLFVREEI